MQRPSKIWRQRLRWLGFGTFGWLLFLALSV
ncbi:hypothetical protein GEI7407_0205 [Geitlerinema sp. PCC 7407]|nr:hypothetical protein GEI7407_0205 [Geitlerinema sp. PCC 7407]